MTVNRISDQPLRISDGVWICKIGKSTVYLSAINGLTVNRVFQWACDEWNVHHRFPYKHWWNFTQAACQYLRYYPKDAWVVQELRPFLGKKMIFRITLPELHFVGKHMQFRGQGSKSQAAMRIVLNMSWFASLKNRCANLYSDRLEYLYDSTVMDDKPVANPDMMPLMVKKLGKIKGVMLPLLHREHLPLDLILHSKSINFKKIDHKWFYHHTYFEESMTPYNRMIPMSARFGVDVMPLIRESMKGRKETDFLFPGTGEAPMSVTQWRNSIQKACKSLDLHYSSYWMGGIGGETPQPNADGTHYGYVNSDDWDDEDEEGYDE